MIVSLVQDGSYRYFYNLNAWKQCLRSVDCSLSCRIHGSILAVLCGVPATIVPFESRTRELAEYHGIPIILPEEINPGDDIVKFSSRFDYEAMRKRHRDNFSRYLDFLHKNGLKTVFDNGGTVLPAPDESIPARDIPCETMQPLSTVSSFVRMKRSLQWLALELYRKLGCNHISGRPID